MPPPLDNELHKGRDIHNLFVTVSPYPVQDLANHRCSMYVFIKKQMF